MLEIIYDVEFGLDIKHTLTPCMAMTRVLKRSLALGEIQPSLTPTVPPPLDLSDGTPVYLYAVICSSDCPSGPPCLLYAEPRGDI